MQSQSSSGIADESEIEPPTIEPVEPDTVAEGESITDRFSEAISDGALNLSCYMVNVVDEWGLPDWIEPIVTGVILFLVLAVLAFLIFFIIRPFVYRVLNVIARRSSTKWDDTAIKFGVAKWISHVVSALLLNISIPGFFEGAPEGISKFIHIAGYIYLVVAVLLVVNSVLNAARCLYENSSIEETRRLPATSVVQVLKLLAFLVALVLLISAMLGKSPMAFLGGLGVFMSIILLVFRDAILGFVAGIHLTSNRMLKLGDWIEVPKHNADGDVIDVGLTTVKIRNFDKTTTTVPTYALISDSFKNWSSMQASGGRRIKRSIHIDLKSIKLCDDALLQRLRKIQLVSDYIDQRLVEIEQSNAERGFDRAENRINGRQLTNIGIFREYIETYLRQNPYIHPAEEMTLLVRQLSSGAEGVPIEVYCFSKNTKWIDFEAVQADIFDHLLAVATEFDLALFQNPTKIEVHT